MIGIFPASGRDRKGFKMFRASTLQDKPSWTRKEGSRISPHAGIQSDIGFEYEKPISKKGPALQFPPNSTSKEKRGRPGKGNE